MCHLREKKCLCVCVREREREREREGGEFEGERTTLNKRNYWDGGRELNVSVD